MSHRVGLDQATVVEAAAKLVDEEGIEQLTLGRLLGLDRDLAAAASVDVVGDHPSQDHHGDDHTDDPLAPPRHHTSRRTPVAIRIDSGGSQSYQYE